jgi:hypothetical protein
MVGVNAQQEPTEDSVGAIPPQPSPVDAVTDEPTAEIVPANLRALEAIYFASMLDEARVFDVADRLVAMFAQGTLPIGPGKAGASLYRAWKGYAHQHRLSAAHRRTVYARAFGATGGGDGVKLNSKFEDLWVRFVSIVGMYSAQLQVLPEEERTIGPEEVLVSGRLLALNLSIHGHGLAWYAAQDFKPEIQHVLEVLSDAEIQNAFGARNLWEVVQKVAASELGAKPNVPRGHTRAESGVIIMRWLSNRRTRLLRPRGAQILKHEDICEGRTAASQNKKATVYPTDYDLVTACEQWLAVTGTQEANLREEKAQTDQIGEPEEEPAAQAA